MGDRLLKPLISFISLPSRHHTPKSTISKMSPQTLPPGNYVITGSNGFVGTHVLNDLLKRDSPAENFLVKAVVRSQNSSDIVSEIFPREISNGKLKIEIVEDMLVEGAFDQVLKGVAQFLASAGKTDTLKKVVLTSSIAAVLNAGEKKTHWTPQDWRIATYEEVVNEKEDAFKIYCASKSLAEQSAWNFVSEKKPSFTLTSICPVFVIGPVLTRAHIPLATTTNDHVWRFCTGSKDTDADVCGWVDVRDVAKAHVESLFSKESDGQRFILYGGSVTSTEILQIAHEKFPDYKDWLRLGSEKKTEVTFTYDTSNLKMLGLDGLKASDLKEEMVKIIESGVKLESESKS